eukprot:5996002-Amphidinium_carterae.1
MLGRLLRRCRCHPRQPQFTDVSRLGRSLIDCGANSIPTGSLDKPCSGSCWGRLGWFALSRGWLHSSTAALTLALPLARRCAYHLPSSMPT